jgi:organic radical activating enzyme
MKRITFNEVELQLTRRCQCKCKHCFRGEAEQKDITPDVIDDFLLQTEMIGLLHITGGEPTLNLDMMQYFLDQLYKKGVLLMKMTIETNGYENSERFVDLIKQYAKMIKICHSMDLKKPEIQHLISVSISNDKYHIDEGCQPEKAYEFYERELKGYANVFYQKNGLVPVAVGRAKSLKESIKMSNYTLYKKRIEILDKSHVPMCPYYKTYKLAYPDQIKVCCSIGLTTDGSIYSPDNVLGEFVEIDKEAFCTVKDDIYKSILEYNRDKITCLNQKKKEMKTQSLYNNMVSLLDSLLEKENVFDDMAESVNVFSEDKKPSNLNDYHPNILDSNIEHDDMKDIENSVKSYFLRRKAAE